MKELIQSEEEVIEKDKLIKPIGGASTGDATNMCYLILLNVGSLLSNVILRS